jgi:hypothetical protein
MTTTKSEELRIGTVFENLSRGKLRQINHTH